MNNNAKLSPRLWFGMLMCSFIGGLAWNVENMYFNTFLWNEVYEGSVGVTALTYTDAVNIMVTFSAIEAVVTTFIMGTLSEKMKNRKAFISFGYIAWGIITALFGFITKENVANIFGISDAVKIVIATAWVVVVMDMIMTFMGSTSNDSAFQAWVTDVTTPETTQTVETAFTFVGFIAMAVIMVVGSLAQGGVIPYSVFFIGLGIVVTIAGVVALFVVDNPKKLEDAKKDASTPKTSYWADLFYGFRPDVIKENSKLYLILVSTGIFNCAFQGFFPYLLTYFSEVVIKENETLFVARKYDLERLISFVKKMPIVGLEARWGEGKTFIVNKMIKSEEIYNEFEIISIDLLTCNLDEVENTILLQLDNVLNRHGIFSKSSIQLKKMFKGEKFLEQVQTLLLDDSTTISSTFTELKNDVSKLDKRVLIIFDDIERIPNADVVRKIFAIAEKISGDYIHILYQYFQIMMIILYIK